ncbi:MAG: hypothetical protein KC493_09480 [Bacteriovoracaceae bacterium]|nr:hypothetical protein [Bacteriovoracaceae bacterium]
MERYAKTFAILGIFLSVILVYYVWQVDFQEYTCESENNGASCAILGKSHEEHHEFERALKYYERSCTLEYSLGCFRFSLLLEQRGEPKRAIAAMEKSCQLGYKEGCKQIKTEK